MAKKNYEFIQDFTLTKCHSIHIVYRHLYREGRRALRVGPLAEAVVVVESLMGTGDGAQNASFCVFG